MSLPLLEPLNAVHLQKLSTIAMAALLAALTVAAATAIIAVASQGTSSSKVLLPFFSAWFIFELYISCVLYDDFGHNAIYPTLNLTNFGFNG